MGIPHYTLEYHSFIKKTKIVPLYDKVDKIRKHYHFKQNKSVSMNNITSFIQIWNLYVFKDINIKVRIALLTFKVGHPN